jgi:hypothetical protein
MSNRNKKAAANIEGSEETKAPQVETLEQAQELINQLTAENATLQATLVDLSTQLEKSKLIGEKAGVRILTDEDGNQYQFMAGSIRLGNQKVSYEDLKKQPETVGALAKGKSPILKKL